VDPNNKNPEDMVVDVDVRADVYEVREVDVLNVEDLVFDVETSSFISRISSARGLSLRGSRHRGRGARRQGLVLDTRTSSTTST